MTRDTFKQIAIFDQSQEALDRLVIKCQQMLVARSDEKLAYDIFYGIAKSLYLSPRFIDEMYDDDTLVMQEAQIIYVHASDKIKTFLMMKFGREVAYPLDKYFT